MFYDVIIVGSGPAGATLASLLKNKKTAIIDRRRLDKPYESGLVKCCGGLLAPDAQKALKRLDISLPQDVYALPQLKCVTTIDLHYSLRRNYRRNYINIKRETFDRYLASLSNADKYYGCVVNNITKTSDGYTVTLTDGTTLNGHLLIGADGAASVVAKAFFSALRVKKYIAAQQSFVCVNGQDIYSAVFDDRLTDYSGWTFVKDGLTYVGGAFAYGNANAMLDRMITELQAHGYIFGTPVSRNGAVVLRPTSLPANPTANGGTVALIGEAAGMISPTSAEGISWALSSARLCADSINRTGKLKHYGITSLKLRVKLLIKQLKLPFMYSPGLRKLVLLSRIFTVK